MTIDFPAARDKRLESRSLLIFLFCFLRTASCYLIISCDLFPCMKSCTDHHYSIASAIQTVSKFPIAILLLFEGRLTFFCLFFFMFVCCCCCFFWGGGEDKLYIYHVPLLTCLSLGEKIIARTKSSPTPPPPMSNGLSLRSLDNCFIYQWQYMLFAALFYLNFTKTTHCRLNNFFPHPLYLWLVAFCSSSKLPTVHCALCCFSLRPGSGFFAAASFMSFQHCLFNFGSESFM